MNAEWGLTQITLKYFELGQYFMSADSVHATMSTEMKKYQNFEDFVKIVDKSYKNVIF